MTQKSCNYCRKLGTVECRRPDYCNDNDHCDFAKSRPWERCPHCGEKFQRPRNKHIGAVVITDLVCVNPDCPGRVGGVPVKYEERREVVLRG